MTGITTESDLRAAAAAGGDVYLDTGTLIYLSDTINVATPVTRIVGGYLKTPPGKPAFNVTCSDVEFSGVRIAGTGSRAYRANERLINIVGTKATPLEQVNVHDCHLWGADGEAVWAEWLRESTFTNNSIEQFSYAGIMCISTDTCVVSGNIIKDGAIAAGQVEVYGIAMTDLTNNPADRCTNMTVTGNQVYQIDYEGIDSHGGLNISITGNNIWGTKRGIALVQGNDTRVTCPMNVCVTGNVVNATGTRNGQMEGICLYGITGGTMATGVISGNVVSNYSTPIYANHYDVNNTYIGGNVT